jgi:4-aminobutyrate aminotransferase/(S)-3-amino-2-methylpropionate transaminase
MSSSAAIKLLTEIPGPRSREILARKQEFVPVPVTVQAPIVIDSAQGALVTDVDGNRLIDFAGGIGCLAVGHAHPAVVEAVREQAGRFLHTDFAVMPYEIYLAVAERLIAAVPFSGPGRAVFFNSGAEAVENAVKFARLATGRSAVIAFEGGFHGRTLLALTMTSKADPYKKGLGPLAPAVYHLPFAQDYRGPDSAEALAELERALVARVAPSEVAAIVVEPIQGEGGFVPAPLEFIRGLRAICDREGIVLVADEVQTGFGRTGKLFAFEHWGLEPDMVPVAKSLSGGYVPVGALIMSRAVHEAVFDGMENAFSHGSTFAPNELAMAAGLATLHEIETQGLVERSARLGEQLLATGAQLAEKYGIVKESRGLGLIWAIEFREPPSGSRSYRALERMQPGLFAQLVIDPLFSRHRILSQVAGHAMAVIKVLPPLVVTDEDITWLSEALDDSIARSRSLPRSLTRLGVGAARSLF